MLIFWVRSVLQGKRGTHYNITVTDYLTRWDEFVHVKYFTVVTATNFLFENVVTRFGCLKILLSDQGTHFVKKMIADLTAKF